MPRPRILVIGEALIDIVDGVEIVGGSPANVALGLGRLGSDVELLTAISHDTRGDRIARHLEASGVQVRPESFVLEHTSTATATVGPDGSAEYEFDIEWEVAELNVDGFDVVHVGSIGCFLEPGCDAVLTTVSRAAAHGAMVTFDPNIRLSLVSGADLMDRVQAIAALSTVLKLSDEDAAAVFPDLDPDQVAERLLALGPRIVAITRGGSGALICSVDQRVEIVAPRTTVVDTVGAGDTFMAALIASVAGQRDLQLTEEGLVEVGTFCAAAAAITVSRAGADLPTWDEVLQTL